MLIATLLVTACSRSKSDSPRRLCEQIYPEMLHTLRSTLGADKVHDDRVRFITACAELPIEFLRCHVHDGPGCIDQLGNMELESRLTGALTEPGRAAPKPGAGADAVKAFYRRLRSATDHPVPIALPDVEIAALTTFGGKVFQWRALCKPPLRPTGPGKLRITHGRITALEVGHGRPFPQGPSPGRDGAVIVDLEFEKVALTTELVARQRCCKDPAAGPAGCAPRGEPEVEATARVDAMLIGGPSIVLRQDPAGPGGLSVSRVDAQVFPANVTVARVTGLDSARAKELTYHLDDGMMWEQIATSWMQSAPARALLEGALKTR